MKPGIQTSEFWLACGTQITALTVALGTTDTTAKIGTAAVALVAVATYLYHRYCLKLDQQQIAAPIKLPEPPSMIPLIAFLLLFLAAGPADAHGWGFRLNVVIAPRPVAPPVYVVPQPAYQVVLVNPALPVPYPTLPVYVTPAGVLPYQMVPTR